MVSRSLYKALECKHNYCAYTLNGKHVRYSTRGAESRMKPENLKKRLMEKTGLSESDILVIKSSTSGSEYAWRAIDAWFEQKNKESKDGTQN